jgi:hypothetical protein
MIITRHSKSNAKWEIYRYTASIKMTYFLKVKEIEKPKL